MKEIPLQNINEKVTKYLNMEMSLFNEATFFGWTSLSSSTKELIRKFEMRLKPDDRERLNRVLLKVFTEANDAGFDRAANALGIDKTKVGGKREKFK
jgi:hypothetical protein